MKLSTLIQFSKLVADSPTSESISSLLSETVVNKCGAFHALVFGTDDQGDFRTLHSYGGCTVELSRLDLQGVEIARGMIAYNDRDATRLIGKRSVDIETLLGFRGRAEMIHRDDLVLMQ